MHGAGMCAQSFALLAKEIKQFARLAAFDFRGHGYSEHPEGEKDLSITTLVNDALEVFNYLKEYDPDATFAIMGHSMGGSVASKLAKQIYDSEDSERVIALIVIDVVEGTALEALPAMEQIVLSKPKKFKSIEDAIRWT